MEKVTHELITDNILPRNEKFSTCRNTTRGMAADKKNTQTSKQCLCYIFTHIKLNDSMHKLNTDGKADRFNVYVDEKTSYGRTPQKKK